jgi:hypothetical protein
MKTPMFFGPALETVILLLLFTGTFFISVFAAPAIGASLTSPTTPTAFGVFFFPVQGPLLLSFDGSGVRVWFSSPMYPWAAMIRTSGKPSS